MSDSLRLGDLDGCECFRIGNLACFAPVVSEE
jgi:hypothetical protein